MPEEDFLAAALQEEDDKEDEAPSLIDLPLTGADDHCNDRRRSMSEPADFFEFMMPDMSCSSYTFSWNDVAWPSSTTAVEKLKPPPSPPRSFSLLLTPSSSAAVSRRVKTRRSESLNESKIATRSPFMKSPCIRPSRSLDYCRLRRNRSTWSSHSDRLNSDCFLSDRGNRTSNGNSKAHPRSPPWYCLMFGPLKFPAAANIELHRNAKSRQSRMPATLFFPAPEKVSCERKGWRLISVLSCKSHGSVAITTPFHTYC